MLEVDTVDEIKAAQSGDSILKRADLSDEIVLTLCAIKILDTYFKPDEKVWNLVVKKARKFITKASILTKDDIDAALSNLKPMFCEHVQS